MLKLADSNAETNGHLKKEENSDRKIL